MVSWYEEDPKPRPIIFAHPHNATRVSRHSRLSFSGDAVGSTKRDNAPAVRSLLLGQYNTNNTVRRMSSGMKDADNAALDKLYDEFNQASDLLVAWKERQTALDMITDSVRTIVRTARAVKRRDPRIIRAVLRKNPDAKDIIKTPAGLWLGYHFGVVPTIHDIHSAANLFSQDFPYKSFSVVGGGQSTNIDRDSWGNGWKNILNCQTKIGGVVTSVNPHLNLAQRLGFGQPLSVAWEMTPFSWFIDYFTNVGQLVTNLEPRFPGFQFQGKYTTRRIQFVCEWHKDPRFRVTNHGRGYTRTVGWPSYSWVIKSPFALKTQQCSYIAAVAVQLLTSMKPK